MPAIAADDPEADPVEALSAEHRRTVGWIRYAEHQIDALRKDIDLVYGLRGRESASEKRSGTGDRGEVDEKTARAVRRYETKLNGWVALLQWERKHLVELTSKSLQFGLDVRRLQLEESMVDQLVAVIGFVVRGLGRDPAEPAVRRIVHQAFELAENEPGRIALPG